MQRFSVVVPLHNKASYVRRAVKSVLSQTLVDFELLVVDDGSTDGGADMVQQLADPRIRVVRQENRGSSMARQRGVLESRAPYVAFLDADDEWLSDFLSEMNTLIDEYPDCRMFASAYEIHEKDGRIATMRDRYHREHWCGRIESYFRNVANKNLIVCSSAVVVDRRAIPADGFLEGRINMGEDQYLWTTIALEHPVAYCQRPLAIYHRDAASSFAHVGPLKSPPCFVPLLDRVIRTGSFRGRKIPRPVKCQLRRYLAESLLQLAILNAKAGDFHAAVRFFPWASAMAKPLRSAAVFGYIVVRSVRSAFHARKDSRYNESTW